MEREKLTLTKEEAREILCNDNKNFIRIKKEIIDTSRWSKQFQIIVQRVSDSKLFRDYYSVGATESQDEGPYDMSDPDFTEVFPIEKTVIVYE